MKKLTFLLLTLSTTNVALAFDYKVVHQAIGCITNEDHSKLTNYAIQKDEIALKKFLTLKLVTGECTVFSVGEPVNVTDTALFSGMVQIRRREEIKEFWTNFEYVKSVDEPKRVEAPKLIEQPQIIDNSKPALQKKELTSQEIEAKKCTDLANTSEAYACLNKVYSKK